MNVVNENELRLFEEAFALRVPLRAALERGATERGWKEAIRAAACKAIEDQYRYGYRNPVWDNLAEKHLAELRKEFPKGVIYLLLLGGHRSSKSEWAGWHVDNELVTKPKSRWWCADATEAASRDNQQRYIEKYLPSEWRPGESGVLDKRRNKVTKVRFTVSGGFTENVMTLPNASECRFKFYEQKLSTLQAVALDGFWGDELLPFEWIDEIEWRLVERNGLFLITFTPYEGWTQTVAHFRDGAQVMESVPADPELLPALHTNGDGDRTAEMVLRVEQCRNPRARVIYFHSSDNPVFGNWEGVKAKAKALPRETIRMRVYGVVEKGAYAQFPMFREDVHVIKLKEWIEILAKWKEGERSQLVDPCSGRMWFMNWVFCPFPKKWIIYREFPSTGHPLAYIPGVGDPGPWAIPGDAHDGVAGPAQKNRGFSLARYKEEMLRLEGPERIFERWIDARYANTPKEQRDAAPVTLIEEMAMLEMDFRATVSEAKILGTPDGSIDMINSALYYDQDTPVGQFSKSLGRENTPQLQVLETCPNTIYALKNWTGKDGQKGACKDPIDNLRAMFLSMVEKHDANMYSWSR